MTGFDAVVIAVTLISGLLAMVRGFVRELLSILAWAAAAVAAVLLLPYVAPAAHDLIEPAWLAEALAAFLIFAVVLVLVSWGTFRLGERVPDGHVGALDRTGGFLFGLARGFILVTIAYLFVAWLVPREDFPGWLRNARLLPLVSATADTLTGALGRADERLETQLQPGAGAEPAVSDDEPPLYTGSIEPAGPPPADTGGSEGYNTSERRQLDQLFESVEGTGSE